MLRPILEYAIQLWNPCQIGDLGIIERVRRRAKRFRNLYGRKDTTRDQARQKNEKLSHSNLQVVKGSDKLE